MGKENLLSSLICGLITLAIVIKLTSFVRNIDYDNPICYSSQRYDKLANNTLKCSNIKYIGRDIEGDEKMYYYLDKNPEMHLIKVENGNVLTAPVDVCGINIQDLAKYDIIDGISRSTYLSNYTFYVVFINLTKELPETTCLYEGDSLLSDVYFGNNFYIVKADNLTIKKAVIKPDTETPKWITLKTEEKPIKWLHISDGFIDYRVDKPIHRIPLFNCSDPENIDEPACIQRFTVNILNVFWIIAVIVIIAIILFTFIMDFNPQFLDGNDRALYEPI